MDCKNPEAEITSRQTFGLFKITRKDYRDDIASRKINRGEFANIMGDVYKAAEAAKWDREVACSVTEKLLANFPVR